MDRSVGSPRTRSVVGVRGPGVSVFGLPPQDSQEKDYNFLGNDTFPNDALVYEGKLKSEYLEGQIYERKLKNLPS